MNIAQKILLIMGIVYMAVGGVIAVIFVLFIKSTPFILMPLFFVVLGASFVGGVLFTVRQKKKISKLGKKYAAKIYGYVNNTSYMVNGCYTLNTKVHYFDENGTEKEAILPTSFARGSDTYPIGMTIDIYEHHGKYSFDAGSVRNEVLFREDELMDNKPVELEKTTIVAVCCESCGATYQAQKGYSNKCPYCGNYYNT